VYPLDVSKPDQVDAFANAIPDDLKKVDILVNNAGIGANLTNTWETDVVGIFFFSPHLTPFRIISKKQLV